MAVTDGTAQFEKRKFADNEKLSIPNIYNKIEIPLSFTQSSPQDVEAYYGVAPSDGYVQLNFFYRTIGTGLSYGNIFVNEGHNGYTLAGFNLSDHTTSANTVFVPVRKGLYFSIHILNISGNLYNAFFVPSLSAT